MVKDKTGGKAFPFNANEVSEDSQGMDLRDYFAAQAMIGILASYRDLSDSELAKRAYSAADAMIKEKNKK